MFFKIFIVVYIEFPKLICIFFLNKTCFNSFDKSNGVSEINIDK